MTPSAMPPRPRAALARLAPYAPPRRREAELLLDFNENTRGCSPAVLAALRGLGAGDLARYPAVEAAEAAITAAYGHSPATGLLTNGTDDAILLAAMAFLDPGDNVVVPCPSFALYAFYAAQMGAEVRPVALRSTEVAPGARPEVREVRFELEETLAAADERTRVVFLASPNNPTGHATARAQVLELCRRLPRAVVFADEAYAEFLDDPAESVLADAGREPNLLVARTFSKAHGMAGLRLGALFGHPATMAVLRRAHSPYNVSTPAAVCGAAAAAAPGWARSFAAGARAARAALAATLGALDIPYWRSQANFVLFDAGARAPALFAALRAGGVLLRDRGGDWPGALRISCGDAAQTARACALLRATWRKLP